MVPTAIVKAQFTIDICNFESRLPAMNAAMTYAVMIEK